jgi:hypothetical protein
MGILLDTEYHRAAFWFWRLRLEWRGRAGWVWMLTK